MAEIISEEQPRIKFQSTYAGNHDILNPEIEAELLKLATLQSKLEALGVIPVLNDGLVGGNCSIRASLELPLDVIQPDSGDDLSTNQTNIFISKSGKDPGVTLTIPDFVLLTNFDRSQWAATYKSQNINTRPSSDAPLHAAALDFTSRSRYGWPHCPRVAVHGHALEQGEGLQAAINAGMPVSEEETLFSTPADLDALENLFKKYPYPEHRCYIRRGHGFFLLADSVEDAEVQFDTLILPLLKSR